MKGVAFIWSLFYRSYYARPLEASLCFVKKKEILNERSRVCKLVSKHKNDQLNPSKHNIYEHTQGRNTNKLSQLGKSWNSFTYQLVNITIFWLYLKVMIFKSIYLSHLISVL